MNQYNQRKEPTFGEPSQTTSDKVESIESAASVEKSAEPKSKLALSLHSKAAPGHTFTPTLKRPADTSQTLLSLEEQAMLNPKNTQNTSETPKQQNGGFAFAPIKENRVETELEKPVETQTTQPENKPEQEKSTASAIERVIPAAAAPAAKAVVEKVPSKYRRLLIVLLLLLALLLAFFLLKPKTPETVENLQQGSSLPIEFRPVDEEEAKRAEAEAKALQEAQAQQAAQQAAAEQTAQPAVAETSQAVAQDAVSQPVQPAQTEQTEQPTAVTKPTQPAAPVAQETVKRPTTSGSVIHQPEAVNKPAVVKPAPAPQPKPQVKAEVAKPQVKAEAAKPAPVKAESKGAPVVTAEPVKMASGVVSIKTMIVPKGVSLMQVFRDHNLNIADVNAMSKVNNIVSNLKAGEKITVHLDKDNRVIEMIIGSGGRFIRQANGTYIYK